MVAMRYEWDERKNALNRQKHGFGFESMERFDWEFAGLLETRFVGQELRELWAGPIDTGLVAVVVTERDADVCRIISLRRATSREKAQWRRGFHHG